MDPKSPNPNSAPADTRLEAGVDLFNRGEYFEAHEIWEGLWMDCPAADRRFIQSLIQAAVAIYHFRRDNVAGAVRLFHSGQGYMAPYRPIYRGLDVDDFWRRMETHLAPALIGTASSAGPAPIIVLRPETRDD